MAKLPALVVITLVLSLLPLYTADATQCVIISEKTKVGDVIYRYKGCDSGASFQLQENRASGSGFVSCEDTNKGIIKVAKDLKRLKLYSDNTRRLKVILQVQSRSASSVSVTIDFIILVEGFADGLIGDLFTKVKSLEKYDNIYSPVTDTYPMYRKLHRILLKGTKKSENISMAAWIFQKALTMLREKIREKLGVSSLTPVHVGPNEMLSVKRRNELIVATGCREALCLITYGPADPYRTIDGSFNNLQGNKIRFGAANTGFTRFLPARYFDAEGLGEQVWVGDQQNPPYLPNPSEVTNDVIVEQAKSQKSRDGLLHMFMQWGQFIDHDMTLGPESECGDKCENISCDGGEQDFKDPCFPILPAPRRSCIRFVRSAAICQSEASHIKPREQINVNTAFLDASMVYGSSKKDQDILRDTTNDRGLLNVSRLGNLPIDTRELKEPENLCITMGGCFAAGDRRVNEQTLLASIHTLFLREHNRIAKKLKNLNHHWKGEKIYQETRKIVGALVQKITYEDWLPLAIGKLNVYNGYKRQINPGISNAFATAAFRMGHTLIRPTFDFLDSSFEPLRPPIPLVQMFFNNTLIRKGGVDALLRGSVGNVSQDVDTELAIGLTQQLFERKNRTGLNLAALNIQRGRDHGLPGYGAFVKECKKRGQYYPRAAVNAATFDDLKYVIKNKTVRNRLKCVYKDDPQNADLWAVGIAETEITGTILGPTFTCLFKDQFERLRDGDRFFYLNNGVFTSDQRNAIQCTTLASIMCANIDLVSVSSNVFKMSGKRPDCLYGIPKLNLNPWKDFRFKG